MAWVGAGGTIAPMTLVSEGLTTRASLLERLRTGSQESWDEFVTLYSPLLEAYIRKILGSNAEGWEDVRQEVLIKLWRALPTFQFDRKQGRFRTWLWTVTRNEAITYVRKKRPGSMQAVPPEFADERAAQPPDELVRAHLEETCKHVVDKVRRELNGDKKWRCFEEYFLKQRASGEVARELGLSASAVYTYTFRVLERCRELARDYDVDM